LSFLRRAGHFQHLPSTTNPDSPPPTYKPHNGFLPPLLLRRSQPRTHPPLPRPHYLSNPNTCHSHYIILPRQAQRLHRPHGRLPRNSLHPPLFRSPRKSHRGDRSRPHVLRRRRPRPRLRHYLFPRHSTHAPRRRRARRTRYSSL